MTTHFNDQMTRIEKMLGAILKSSNHLWWIGGYVYGQTSNGDPYVILYPAAEMLKEKVCRVYEHDFKRLPLFIPTDNIEGDTEANPSKEVAQRKGIYHDCPRFQIVTCDGKETQMGRERRFFATLYVPEAHLNVPPVPAAKQQSTAAPPKPTNGNGQTDPALPDYRHMALTAATVKEFMYAAYMSLKGNLYDDQEKVVKACDMLASAMSVEWKPDRGRANDAMYQALATYRDRREKHEATDGVAVAHSSAKAAAIADFQRIMNATEQAEPLRVDNVGDPA